MGIQSDFSPEAHVLGDEYRITSYFEGIYYNPAVEKKNWDLYYTVCQKKRTCFPTSIEQFLLKERLNVEHTSSRKKSSN